MPSKSTTMAKADWRQPKLGGGLIALNMDMPRFGNIARVKVKAVRTDDFDGRHAVIKASLAARPRKLDRAGR